MINIYLFHYDTKLYALYSCFPTTSMHLCCDRDARWTVGMYWNVIMNNDYLTNDNFQMNTRN